MKFLVDANLSPVIAAALNDSGFDALHVADLGLATASDDEIFDQAASDEMVVITADSDFPMMLALRRATSPSVVHLRHVTELSPKEHAALLVANLPALVDALDRGAIASLAPDRVRLRDLPIR